MSDRIGTPPDPAHPGGHGGDGGGDHPIAEPPVGLDATIDERLRLLEIESARRSTELRELAAAVPAAMSRRAVIAAMIADLRAAPDKWTVLRRVAAKIGRLPGELLRRTTGP